MELAPLSLLRFCCYFMIALPLLSNCGLYVAYLERDKKIPLLPTPAPKTYCTLETPQDQQLELLSDARFDTQNSKAFIQAIGPHSSYNFTDKVILWSLYQMNLRPHIVAPTARAQIFLAYKGQWHYWDFGPAQNPSGTASASSTPSYPLIQALQFLAQKQKASRSLPELAGQLGQLLPSSIAIDEQFADFLSKHRDELYQKAPIFTQSFFKAQHTLKADETIPKLNFAQIVSKALAGANKAVVANEQLFSYPLAYSANEQIDIRCNQDMTPYQQANFQVSSESIAAHTHSFALTQGQDFFIASVGQNLVHGEQGLIPWQGTYLFKGEPSQRSSAFCRIQNPATGAEFAMFSLSDRDPGQYFYQMFNQNLAQVASLRDLEQFMLLPRHLFLPQPLRLVLESKRASRQHIDQFLQMSVPLYHAKSLGKLWSAARFKVMEQQGLVTDPRAPGHFYCDPQ